MYNSTTNSTSRVACASAPARLGSQKQVRSTHSLTQGLPVAIRVEVEAKVFFGLINRESVIGDYITDAGKALNQLGISFCNWFSKCIACFVCGGNDEGGLKRDYTYLSKSTKTGCDYLDDQSFKDFETGEFSQDKFDTELGLGPSRFQSIQVGDKTKLMGGQDPEETNTEVLRQIRELLTENGVSTDDVEDTDLLRPFLNAAKQLMRDYKNENGFLSTSGENAVTETMEIEWDQEDNKLLYTCKSQETIFEAQFADRISLQEDKFFIGEYVESTLTYKLDPSNSGTVDSVLELKHYNPVKECEYSTVASILKQSGFVELADGESPYTVDESKFTDQVNKDLNRLQFRQIGSDTEVNKKKDSTTILAKIQALDNSLNGVDKITLLLFLSQSARDIAGKYYSENGLIAKQQSDMNEDVTIRFDKGKLIYSFYSRAKSILKFKDDCEIDEKSSFNARERVTLTFDPSEPNKVESVFELARVG